MTKMAVTPFDPPWPNPHAARKLYDSIFYITGVIANQCYIAGIGIISFFCLCGLDFDPMTFMCELDPYSFEIYRMCK